MEFSKLNLHADLQRGIGEAGYLTCMPVQEQVLTHAFGGQDLYVQSQTGTGKTAAFLIVIFQRLLSESLLGGKKALIMVPTRELAVQVEKEAKTLGKYLPFKAGSFYGGVGYAQQQGLLRDNVQIMVGTPGRVLDLNKSGHMNLMDMAFLVIDEADRMFDMGFYPDLRKLIGVVPPADRRQTMLFSATLNTWVKNLAWEYTKNPYEIEIEPETVTVEEVEQLLYHVHSVDKMRLLLGIMEREQPESAIIFCNTKRYAEIVAKRLRVNGIACEFIMGDLPQVKRLKIIEDLKADITRVLVATDVAARGLDIEALALVINYDLPADAENYVHRIGRTARAGKTGKALSLVSEQDVYELADIEKYIGKKIPSEIAGEELFGQDKSEGLRIHTDFYDDRTDRRKREGRGRSGGFGDRNSGAAAARGSRQGGLRRDRKEGRGRKPYEAGRTETDPPGQRSGRPEEGRNLSGLSLEERMSYYKEKYEGKGGDKPPETGKPRRDRASRPLEASRPSSRSPRPSRSPEAPRPSSGLSRTSRSPEASRPSSRTSRSPEASRPSSGSSRTSRSPEAPRPSSRSSRPPEASRNGNRRGGRANPAPARQKDDGGFRPQEGPARSGPPEDASAKKPGLFGKLLGMLGKKKHP
ncbi:MAG: DEAD/DEAH box helicase [Spirochaetaceae bacterium]|jgi:ATP-dependent RNA helicase RhlB|nr:DEAD/DEAH box helicase [Spirochaetaceae bacterium]